MTSLPPVNIIRPKTLAEVIERLKSNHRLTETSRRDLISATRTTANLLGRSCEDVGTDIPGLRTELLKLRPAQRGMTAKRYSNIKSALALALQLTRAIPRRPPSRERSDAWAEFLLSAEARHQGWSLSRFVTYCAARSVEPREVTDDHMKDFLAHLDCTLLTKRPFDVCKEMVQAWNSIIRRKKLEGFNSLSPLRAERYAAPPLATYSKPLQDDIAKYLARLRCEDIFAEDGPDKPVKDITIRNIEAHLRQYLDALVAAGHDKADICSLANLVDREAIRAAFGQLTRRTGRNASTGARNILATLIAIAKHYVRLPEQDVMRLRSNRFFGRGARNQECAFGMTDKNMARLSQFDQSMNMIQLTGLPEVLLKRARTRPDSHHGALDAMYAAAIAILLVFPIRMSNLANLDIQRHLTWTVSGTRRLLTIRIEGTEVKNGQPLEVDLREEIAKLVWAYVQEFRPKICGGKGTALFPWASGAVRAPVNLGQALSAVILRETGIDVNPHLFRHLAGKRYLERNPGKYEVVRRVLGHKRIDTTLNFYTRLENKWALVEYDKTVSSNPSRRK